MADGILGDVGINVDAEGPVGNRTSATSSATYTPSLTSGTVPPAATSFANERDGASMYLAGEAFAATPAAAFHFVVRDHRFSANRDGVSVCLALASELGGLAVVPRVGGRRAPPWPPTSRPCLFFFFPSSSISIRSSINSPPSSLCSRRFSG